MVRFGLLFSMEGSDMKLPGFFIFATIVILLPYPLPAATVLVPDDGHSIQAAIDAASYGDVVIVGPGVYRENVDFLGKGITLQSRKGPKSTTIDGGLAGPAVTFEGGNTDDAVLSGFTVRKGSPVGIFCYEASPAITGCIVTRNEGGGIYCGERSQPVISKCVVSKNSDTGIVSWGMVSWPKIIGCEIMGNQSDDRGGGLYCSIHSAATVSNCLITGNKAWYGGGINSYGDLFVTNSIITGNHAGLYSGGLYIHAGKAEILSSTVADNSTGENSAGIFCMEAEVDVSNSILWGNADPEDHEISVHGSASSPAALSIEHSDIQGGEDDITVAPGCTLDWGDGNIDADPRFIQKGDYHLRAWSPCIDAGADVEVDDDIDGNARPWGRGFDIGADEFVLGSACFIGFVM